MTLCVFALKKTAGICGCHKIGKDGLAVCVLTRSVPAEKKCACAPLGGVF
jgi:hypothetical protein